MLPEQLVPIQQIVKMSGTDKIHFAYLAKLHLIPSAIRRKLANGKISGCYPESVVNTLRKIENLKNQGLSYSQIKAQLSIINSTFAIQANKFNLALAFSAPVFLIIGVFIGYLLATSTNNKTVSLSLLPESDYQKVLRIAKPDKTETLYVAPESNPTLYKTDKIVLTNLIN